MKIVTLNFTSISQTDLSDTYLQSSFVPDAHVMKLIAFIRIFNRTQFKIVNGRNAYNALCGHEQTSASPPNAWPSAHGHTVSRQAVVQAIGEQDVGSRFVG